MKHTKNLENSQHFKPESGHTETLTLFRYPFLLLLQTSSCHFKFQFTLNYKKLQQRNLSEDIHL